MFTELSGRSEEDQKRLLNEAGLEAFREWRLILGVLPFSLSCSTGVALVNTLSKLEVLPKPGWITDILVGLVIMAAVLFAGKVIAYYLRPYLRRVLERPQNGAVTAQTPADIP
ncbi:MAG: hypothetical protein HY300_06125 [Verrucomicrobia bacterium]|nr:hypothetical protein [Verrucomicrobiota bacterium]